MYYKKTSELMKSLVNETKIKDLYYTPYTFAFNGHLQAIWCCILESFLSIYYPIKYDREMFTLSDGGTIAYDWVVDSEGGPPRKNSTRPILCCFPGLSGGNDTLYLYSMIKAATKKGYKCVVINFRGCGGLKLTSPKIYWMCNWQDVQEPIEHIHSKYCSDVDGYQKRNIYAYSLSLGAGMLTKYMIETGEKCVLNGCVNLCTFYNIQDNVPFFKTNAWKLYDYSLGQIYYNVLKKKEEELI